MAMIVRHHYAEVDGWICPEDGTFVVAGHFLDGGCRFGHPAPAHEPAKQVITIYKITQPEV